MHNAIIKLIKWMFRRNLRVEEANELCGFVLEKMGALPIRDVIAVSEEGLLINGESVDIDKARKIHESANAALDNACLRLVREQVAYAAVTYGVHKAETPTQMLFARAALWWGQQEHRLLEALAARQKIGE